MKQSRRTSWWRVVTLVVVISMLLAACGGGGQQPTPAPQIVEKVVTQIVEVEKEVEKEVTTVVEVEKEVTTIVEVEGETLVVTATPDPNAETEAEGEGDAEEGEFVANADASGRVEFWHHYGSPDGRNAIRRVLAICQQRLPNLEIVETFKPFGEGWTANIAAVAAGSGMPDLIISNRPTLPQDAEDGVYQSLQEFAARDGVSGENFWPFTWNEALYEGETYGMPWETDVRVFYWNKNAFTAAGLDPEDPPETWEELEAAADALDRQAEDGTWERIGFSPLQGLGADTWAFTNGWEPATEDGSTVNVNDPALIETINWVKGWIDRYGGWQNHQDFFAQFGAPPNEAFMSGKLAMKADTPLFASRLILYRPRIPVEGGEEGATEELQWGVSLLPYNTEPASWSGGFSLSIPTGAPNPEGGWELAKCMGGREAQASWARDRAAIPSNVAAATDPVLLADPRWQVYFDAMEVSRGSTFIPGYSNWSEQLAQRWEAIWTGDVTPEQAMQDAQAA
ncbi:MAG TPA: ABC transporter substrate-binding protein, partial [Ardenticatenaceae bacterium]|nr:ABC transporter substrate-binding protein [Ardenticatenaceae bacterium]